MALYTYATLEIIEYGKSLVMVSSLRLQVQASVAGVATVDLPLPRN
jgi:hypothetical protein